jgi:NAD(P)-dependent dehydrogenase (short-subunit alcohol dehydrogenase family)
MKPSRNVKELYGLSGRVVIITGGAGLLGSFHAEAIAEAGGYPVLADINAERCDTVAAGLSQRYGIKVVGLHTDVTDKIQVEAMMRQVLDEFGRVDVLINNAANNPKVEDTSATGWSRLESFPLEQWNRDLAVGLTGAFLCSQVLGTYMSVHGGGVILNIASTMAIAAPDQRIYIKPGLPPEEQMAKPVSYPPIKAGLLGLTSYLATYWAEKNVRVNAISPGGVYDGQTEPFLSSYTNRVPMRRMAQKGEYKGAILFLCSDASSYMTGANLVIDGGLTCW